MSDQQIDYEDIRRRAEQRVKKRAEFWQHLAIYVVVNLFLWLLFGIFSAYAGGPGPLIVPLLSTVGWGMGLVIHGIVTYVETNMDRMREREIDREIQREMQRRGLTSDEVLEKPKRDQTVRLSDDGELIYEDEEPAEARQSKGRQSRR